MTERHPEVAKVAWVGNSIDVLRGFPKAIRFDLGGDIWKLQLGETPTDSRPMQSIGKGVFELRKRDARGWYRIIYLTKVDDTFYMLHSFVKKSAKTSRKDLAIAKQRLQTVRQAIQEKKKNAKN
jgi:phage-related protein